MTHSINLQKEMAWVTFLDQSFEKVWFPVTDKHGHQLDWDSAIVMEFCREQFNRFGIQFGIAPTSQMVLGNSVRDNF